jgi:hypothetical protein
MSGIRTRNVRVAVRFLGFEAGAGFSKFQLPLSINLTTITTYTGITDANDHKSLANLSHKVVSSATRHEWDSNSQC